MLPDLSHELSIPVSLSRVQSCQDGEVNLVSNAKEDSGVGKWMASLSSTWLCWWRPVSDWHSDDLHCASPKLGILGANPFVPP